MAIIITYYKLKCLLIIIIFNLKVLSWLELTHKITIPTYFCVLSWWYSHILQVSLYMLYNKYTASQQPSLSKLLQLNVFSHTNQWANDLLMSETSTDARSYFIYFSKRLGFSPSTLPMCPPCKLSTVGAMPPLLGTVHYLEGVPGRVKKHTRV